MSAPSLYRRFDSKMAIYGAMFAQGAQAYLECAKARERTGQALEDLQAGMRDFVQFCTEDPVRYQLLFQRTIPGFEPTPETYTDLRRGLQLVRDHLTELGLTDPKALDLLTAIGNGLADQQISNDPGGDRWSRLVDEAMEMLFTHMTTQSKSTREVPKVMTATDIDQSSRSPAPKPSSTPPPRTSGCSSCSGRSTQRTGRSRRTARRGTCGRWPVHIVGMMETFGRSRSSAT